MFSFSQTTMTSFESSWKTEQEVVSDSTQTEAYKVNDKECQVASFSEAGCQTLEETHPVQSSPEYNETSLLAFLRKITPKVEKELEKMQRSRAFVGYAEIDESMKTNAKCLHTLRWQQLSAEHVVTCVDWSSTGSVIGVGYGANVHDDWCYHKGAIAVWNINRLDLAVNTPEQVMEISTCVTSIAFHPNNPAWVAVGNMSGELMVFDLSHSIEATPFCSNDCGGGSVTCLRWQEASLKSFSKGSLCLISTSTEGTVLVWTVNHSKESLTLAHGFLLERQEIPREVRSRLNDSSGVGITSITFNSEDSSLFVLGTEGGALLLCTTLSQISTGTEIHGIPLMKCITSTLSAHAGRVLRVNSSPFHRNALHTLGSDNSLRLYSLLQANKPASVFYSEIPLTCSQWSPSRPIIAAVGATNGQILFYNFATKSSPEPFTTLESAGKSSPISSLVFNKKSMNLLAAGDHLGRVFIWELPESIVSPSTIEHSTLSKMVQVSSD